MNASSGRFLIRISRSRTYVRSARTLAFRVARREGVRVVTLARRVHGAAARKALGVENPERPKVVSVRVVALQRDALVAQLRVQQRSTITCRPVMTIEPGAWRRHSCSSSCQCSRLAIALNRVEACLARRTWRRAACDQAPVTNASRSRLMTSGCVVHIPCDNPS